jgi:hypothetical protein
MNGQVDTTRPSVQQRRALHALASRAFARDWPALVLALIGVASFVVALAQAPAVVHQLYRDADTAVAFVLPQLAGQAPGGATIDLGNHSWYEAWWFMRATVGLPGHLQMWEAAPFVVAFLGIGVVSWTAWMALGRRAALYCAVALLSIGAPMRNILFEPDVRVELLLHMGLLCAALLLVWERTRRGTLSRRWMVAGGAALAAFTAAGATDQLLIFDGVVPYMLAPCAWWWRTRSRPASTVAYFAILTGTPALVGSLVLSHIMRDAGIGASLSLSSFQFVSVANLAPALGNTLGAWVALGDGSFFGAQVNRASALTFGLGMLCILALAVALRALWHTAGAWWASRSGVAGSTRDGSRDLFVAFWGLALVLTIASNLLTSASETADSRYLLGAWVAVAALLGALATTREGHAVLTIALVAFAATTLRNNIAHGVPPPGIYYEQPVVREIEQFVVAHGARVGYAAYDDSHNFTWATHFKVDVFPIWPCPLPSGSLCQRPLASISSWYLPRPHTPTFVITDSRPGGLTAPPPAAFGHAKARATFGFYTVYAYDHDIAAQLLHY